MIAAAILALVAAQSPTPSPFDPSRLDAMAVMATRLRAHVSYLDVQLKPPADQPLADTSRDGFGVAWGPRRVACLSFLVEDAVQITVHGPRGKATARVLLSDAMRRVAILETARPLAELGLVPVTEAPPEMRAEDTTVFALVGTTPESHVLVGRVLDDGKQPELEGHVRVSLTLSRGTPVFDDRARFLGYARAVAWDRDTAMIVMPEHIRAASTATTATAAPKPSPSDAWWTR